MRFAIGLVIPIIKWKTTNGQINVSELLRKVLEKNFFFPFVYISLFGTAAFSFFCTLHQHFFLSTIISLNDECICVTICVVRIQFFFSAFRLNFYYVRTSHMKNNNRTTTNRKVWFENSSVWTRANKIKGSFCTCWCWNVWMAYTKIEDLITQCEKLC